MDAAQLLSILLTAALFVGFAFALRSALRWFVRGITTPTRD